MTQWKSFILQSNIYEIMAEFQLPAAAVTLPEYNGYFTGNFTCGSHANLPATSKQNCLILQAKIHAICRQKH